MTAALQPDRRVLVELLERWARGEITERQVHEEAETLIEDWGWPRLPKSDPRSIPVDVAHELEALNVQWIFEDDIPAMLTFLNTPAGGEAEAWRVWESYWEGIDYDDRKAKLSG